MRRGLVLGATALALSGGLLAASHSGSSPVVTDVPGVIDTHVTQANIATTICVRGYTATVRPPTSYTGPLKQRLMASHHYGGSASSFELDHEISLELGGAPSDPQNLWLEPQPRATAVDKIENQLHAQVCNGTLTLAQAQAQIVKLKHTQG